MRALWDTYQRYEPAGSCGVHAKAIEHVLGEYEGYVREPIVVTIHEFPAQPVRDRSPERSPKSAAEKAEEEEELRQEFHIRARSNPVQIDQEPELPLLMRVLIKVRPKKMKGQKVKAAHKHSNLIIIMPKEKHIYRFEPLLSFKYNDQVNDALEVYFKAALPDYEFSEMDQHPQKVAKQGETGCHVTSAAFVIKAGVMFALDMDIDFPSDEDSQRFASALQHWEDWGDEERHKGISHPPKKHEYGWGWGGWDRHHGWRRRHHGWRRGHHYGRDWEYGLGASVKVQKNPPARPGVRVERVPGDQEYSLGWALLGGAAAGALVGYVVAKNTRPRTVYVERPVYVERERPYYVEREYGHGGAFVGGALAGAVVGSALAGGYAPYPAPCTYYDPYYCPDYYGPRYGPRYIYTGGYYGGRGWRGGDRRGHHHGGHRSGGHRGGGGRSGGGHRGGRR